MPAFPLSPRLAALPLWALAEARAQWTERGRPLLQARVNRRHPLPPPEELHRIADTDAVRGLRLVVEDLSGGWATLAGQREALERIRASGKLVFVELERCGNAELYLASAADRVWLRPMGEVQALGVAASLRFAGAALARLGVRFDFEAAGAYKSFAESFTRSFASAPNREATRQIVDDLQAELVGAIARGRGLPEEVVARALAEGPLPASEARARGLVDAVGYPDEAVRSLEEIVGEDRRVVPLHRWLRVSGTRDRIERWVEARPVVVVLHLRGPVVDGEGPPGNPAIAATPVTRVLRALGEDRRVAAVVLAVSSPGGSAAASDLIWREVERLARSRPVVAAFGDVAASGGYYLAAGATEIWAQPNTLTGSIGVVGGKVVLGEALGRLGVHGELVRGSPMAGMYGDGAPFSPEERARFRAGLERFYQAFVERVAAGRRRPYPAVEEHARGRVWTGRRAQELGLVDKLGDTRGAVARAAALAGVRAPRRVDLFLAPRTTRLARLLRAWMEAAWPELRLVPALPPLVGLLLASAGRPLFLWPVELDVGEDPAGAVKF